MRREGRPGRCVRPRIAAAGSRDWRRQVAHVRGVQGIAVVEDETVPSTHTRSPAIPGHRPGFRQRRRQGTTGHRRHHGAVQRVEDGDDAAVLGGIEPRRVEKPAAGRGREPGGVNRRPSGGRERVQGAGGDVTLRLLSVPVPVRRVAAPLARSSRSISRSTKGESACDT